MPPVRATPVKAEMGFSAWPCSSFLSSSHTCRLNPATSSNLSHTSNQLWVRTLQSQSHLVAPPSKAGERACQREPGVL